MERLTASLERTEGLASRLFHPNELDLSKQSLAARFAAKEALAKAIGDPKLLRWSEIEIVKDSLGNPGFQLHGQTAANIAKLGDLKLHLSLTHDAQLAQAFVVLESS